MKVVILCGGLGTRLREETEFRPKPMVNIGTRPILWHIMKIYAHYGYNDFILCLGYKGEMIKEFFYHYELMNNDVILELGSPEKTRICNGHDEKGWRVALVNTGEKALKGARLKKIEKYVDDTVFMMTYGDGIADIDINALLSFHRSHGKLATVTGINFAARFGELKIDGNRVDAFYEKPKNSSEYVSGGFFVFNKGIFEYLTTDDSCDLELGALDTIARKGELMVYKHPKNWACMDTLRDTEHLNKLWSDNKAFWKVWK